MRLLLLEEPTTVNTFLYSRLLKFGDVIRARSLLEASAQCMAFDPDVIVTECSVGRTTSPEILSELKSVCPESPIVMIARTDTAAATVAKMQLGAFSVLARPVLEDELAQAVDAALLARAKRQDPAQAPEQTPEAAPQPSVTIPIDTDLRMAEDMFIDAVLDHFEGSVSAAAKSLGVSASTLYRRQDRRRGS